MKTAEHNSFLQRVNILEIVKSVIQLKKRGRNYFGLCPFHKDNLPSLCVSDSKQIFKCFSCGVGGDVITFVMYYENLNRNKAIVWIAEKLNITLSAELTNKIKITKEMSEIIKVNEEGNVFFQINLLNSKNLALSEYCQKRNINEEILKKFQIGWMDDNNEKIIKYFEHKGITKNSLINSKLFDWDYSKKIKCYFQNRLIFPILNEEGYLIGFSGRKIDNKNSDKPKYLNSRENVVFKKNSILYNFHYIIENFKTLKNIYLVEGFMDSIRMIMHKYPAIALMGTVLSNVQINLIKERYKEVVIFPDYDLPGIKSALKNAALLTENQIKVLIIDHESKKDPDLILQEKNFIMEDKIKKHPIDFIINQKQKSLSAEEIKNFFLEIKVFWSYLRPIEKYQFSEKISIKFQIPQEVINEELDKNNPKKNNFIPVAQKQKQREAWKELFFMTLLYHPELIAKSKKIDGIFNDEKLDFFYDLLINWEEKIEQKNELNYENLINFLQNSLEQNSQKNWLANLNEKHKNEIEYKNISLNIFQNYLKMFREEKLKAEIQELSEKLSEEKDQNKQFFILKKIQLKTKEKNTEEKK